jgi:ferredoxin
MIVRFTGANGTVTQVEGVAGERLLDAAWRADMPLEGTCNGMIACATCHLILDPADADRVPPPTPEEEDMLDLAPDAVRTSRLSCQIILTPELGDLAVRLPGASGNGQAN